MKYVYVKRLKDGVVLDIPETQLQETLKRGFELVSPVNQLYEKQDITKVEIPKPEFECPLCGKLCKTAMVLGKHKKTHYEDNKEQN